MAVTGASNATGYVNPIHQLAEKAHAVGALFLADCAQLAPHRTIEARPMDDPEHLDFVALSAHKMYAPYGTGALIGRKDVLEAGEPDTRGGGTVEIVTVDSVAWSRPPEKDEACCPNVVGAVAPALAIRELSAIGMPAVARHEAELTEHALRGMACIPGVRVFGDSDPASAAERLGVIPFSVDGVSHFLVAAIPGCEHGIGVRSGCFCAHPYVLRLTGLDHTQADAARARVLGGDRSNMPGMTRISFGVYNTIDEVDRFLEALAVVAAGRHRGHYTQDRATGEFRADGWEPDFGRFSPSQPLVPTRADLAAIMRTRRPPGCPGGLALGEPVSRVLSPAHSRFTALRPSPACVRMGDHLSGPPRCRVAQAAYPGLGGDEPPPGSRRTVAPAWPCSRRGLPGRSHCWPRRWSLTPPFHPDPGLRRGGLFLWPCPRVAPPGDCPAPCPVERGLSSAG